MSPLAFVVHVAALVLAVSGVRKVASPQAVSSALRAAGLPSGAVAGRLIGLVEIGVGAWVLAWGGAPSAGAMAAVYAGFIAFIGTNRVRGLHVPCGCFGESDRPPGVAHMAVDVIALGAGVAAVAWPVGAATEWLDHGAAGAAALVAAVAAGAGVIAGLERVSGSSRR